MEWTTWAAAVCDRTDLTDGAKLAAMYLADGAHGATPVSGEPDLGAHRRPGSTTPVRRGLAARLGCSEESVTRYCRELRAAGLLRLVRRPGLCWEYVPMTPEQTPVASASRHDALTDAKPATDLPTSRPPDSPDAELPAIAPERKASASRHDAKPDAKPPPPPFLPSDSPLIPLPQEQQQHLRAHAIQKTGEGESGVDRVPAWSRESDARNPQPSRLPPPASSLDQTLLAFADEPVLRAVVARLTAGDVGMGEGPAWTLAKNIRDSAGRKLNPAVVERFIARARARHTVRDLAAWLTAVLTEDGPGAILAEYQDGQLRAGEEVHRRATAAGRERRRAAVNTTPVLPAAPAQVREWLAAAAVELGPRAMVVLAMQARYELVESPAGTRLVVTACNAVAEHRLRENLSERLRRLSGLVVEFRVAAGVAGHVAAGGAG